MKIGGRIMARKRILFGASYSAIEPLGLLHLAGLAKSVGWDSKIHLVKNHDFGSFFEKVKDFKPDAVGFNVYTGNHTQLAEAFKKLRRDSPGIMVLVGGPHATYFPVDSLTYADYVIMSEGFGGLRHVLNGTAKPGILPMQKIEQFPRPDRRVFYADYPEHAASYIKSLITMTGCPYTCTYCYNSSTPADLSDSLPADVAASLGKAMGMGGRLFPKNVRPLDDIIAEGKEIAENWPTEVIYFQDDVFGFDTKPGGMLEQLAERWPREVGIPFHAQMRWEMTVNDAGKRRLDLIRKAGGFGLTLAIEAADYVIRKEVLDRAMPERTMFDGMKNVIGRGFKVRTEQITGLPYGATTTPTRMNLDADLELLELNIRLREETGGPTMAWASTFAPYNGTKLAKYCETHGHYESDNNDVKDTFFESSVLRFPREWVGADLAGLKNDPSVWLGDGDLDKYRKQNAELRRTFNFFVEVPRGHELARSYLASDRPYTHERLGRETEDHLNRLDVPRAKSILQKIGDVRRHVEALALKAKAKKDLTDLAPYFACVPKGTIAVDKLADCDEGIDPATLSTSIRHHLYDNVLYSDG